MANELTLIMETPVEQLIPKMLAWNNEELLARVEATLSQYQGVVYDDSQIVEAKGVRAQLNTFCKALNDERIRIGKIYTSPYDRFKGEVDVVISKVKEVVAHIDGQVVAYENKKKEEKQNEIIECFKSVIGEFSGLIPYERVHNPKWLNASTSIKSIKADIDKIIENAYNALAAIEALKSEDEAVLKAFYFRTLDLSGALVENERLRAERARIAELKAKQEEQKATAATAEAVEETKPVAASTLETKTVKFAVEATVEQLKALSQFLKENKIKYYAI